MRTVCLKRRQLLASLGALGLSGCANIPQVTALAEGLKPLVSGPGDYPITREQLAQLPYAYLGVDVGGVSKAVMVLREYQGRDLMWMGADRSMLVTRNGRIVRTVGLKTDLREVSSQSPEPLDLPSTVSLSDTVRLVRQMEWTGKEAGSYPAQVRLSTSGVEDVRILGWTYSTRLIEETVEVRALDWQITNRYWLDVATSKFVRSEQRVHPTAAPLTLEILKPAT